MPPRRHDKVTDDIYFDGLTVSVVKVQQHLGAPSDPEFCYVYSREEALMTINSLAVTLTKEISEDEKVQSGWTEVIQEVTETDTAYTLVISTRALGRAWNGPKVTVYTLSYTVVPHGICEPNNN